MPKLVLLAYYHKHIYIKILENVYSPRLELLSYIDMGVVVNVSVFVWYEKNNPFITLLSLKEVLFVDPTCVMEATYAINSAVMFAALMNDTR